MTPAPPRPDSLPAIAAPLAEARDPTTPGARLAELATHAVAEVRLAVASNPATPREAFDTLLMYAYRVSTPEVDEPLVVAILSNPAVDFCLLEDPEWLREQPYPAALTIASSPALSPLHWEALRGHEAERVATRLLLSPRAPAEAWKVLGFASELDGLLTCLSAGSLRK